MIDVKLRVFIPSRAVLVPLPVAGDIGFDGDNRDFSYDEGTSRAELWVDVDNSPLAASPVTVKRREFGESRWYVKDKLVDVWGKPFWWKAVRRNPFLQIEDSPDGIATAVVTGSSLSVTGAIESSDPFGLIKNAHITFRVNAAVPFEVLAPAIDCRFDILMSATGLPAFAYSVTGFHDGFPAYELYLQQRRVYAFHPVQAGTSPLNLAPGREVQVNIPLTAFV
jgi:hypothetical protein